MKREFTADELLPLSGIQHFLFCRRQWALLTIERLWEENVLTVEGKLLHERVDDPFFTEVRKETIIARSVPVASYRLGLIGVCDLVEFTLAPEGVSLKDRQGCYLPAPVEYKRGRPKREPMDEAQLCAQAMCLEEMLLVEIPHGWLYYGQTRHRYQVPFTPELRLTVSEAAAEMHHYFQRGYTPRVKPHKGCRSCSLANLCLPQLQGESVSALQYIRQVIESEE